MAIHVKELVIKANVGMEESRPAEHGASANHAPHAAMVQAAVAEVMRILKDKQHR